MIKIIKLNIEIKADFQFIKRNRMDRKTRRNLIGCLVNYVFILFYVFKFFLSVLKEKNSKELNQSDISIFPFPFCGKFSVSGNPPLGKLL